MALLLRLIALFLLLSAPASPVAAAEVIGSVKVDGTSITATSDGTLSAAGGGSGCLVSGAAGSVYNTGSSTCGTLAGTTTTVLHGNAAGAPSFAAIGSGDLAASLSLTTPTLGVATATSVNKVALTAPATSATLTIADGKTLTSSNTLTLTATDGSTLAIGGGGTLGSMAYQAASAVAVTGGTVAGLTGLAIRDTSAAFDLTLAAVSSTALTAGRTLTVDVVNAARTLKLGSNLTIITDPGAVSGAVKGSAGTFTQAACADLSNGGTGCSATIANYAPLASPTFTGTVTVPAVVSAVSTQSGTSYTLAATDCGTLINFTSGSAITLTTLSTLPVGCHIVVRQGGAGQVTVADGSGATHVSASSYTKTRAQYAKILLSVNVTTVVDIDGDGA